MLNYAVVFHVVVVAVIVHIMLLPLVRFVLFGSLFSVIFIVFVLMEGFIFNAGCPCLVFVSVFIVAVLFSFICC